MEAWRLGPMEDVGLRRLWLGQAQEARPQRVSVVGEMLSQVAKEQKGRSRTPWDVSISIPKGTHHGPLVGAQHCRSLDSAACCSFFLFFVRLGHFVSIPGERRCCCGAEPWAAEGEDLLSKRWWGWWWMQCPWWQGAGHCHQVRAHKST